jgi:hypothetical protein
MQENLCDKNHRGNVQFVFTFFRLRFLDFRKLFGSALQPGGKPG